jgi:hypothetical protein
MSARRAAARALPALTCRALPAGDMSCLPGPGLFRRHCNSCASGGSSRIQATHRLDDPFQGFGTGGPPPSRTILAVTATTMSWSASLGRERNSSGSARQAQFRGQASPTGRGERSSRASDREKLNCRCGSWLQCESIRFHLLSADSWRTIAGSWPAGVSRTKRRLSLPGRK